MSIQRIYYFFADIDWNKVGLGIALSMGQVWAVNNLAASSLINVAVFLHSPLLFVMATIGATIGTLIGAAFLPADSLWEGKWKILSFCPILGIHVILYRHKHLLINYN